MQMATRIRRSWQKLVEQMLALEPGDRAFIGNFQEWLRQNPANVSKKAAEAMHRSKGIELFLKEKPTEIPFSVSVADEFMTLLRRINLPSDPVSYIDFVDGLCWNLAVFRREDDCCPKCQGNLELWSDGTSCFEVCDFLGCCFNSQGIPIEMPSSELRPANRQEVLKRYPQAGLVILNYVRKTP